MRLLEAVLPMTVAVLLILYWISISSSSPNFPEHYVQNVRQLANATQLRVYTLVDTLSSDMKENLASAVTDLFKELDKDGDGCISKAEFQGMTLNTWAAMRAFGLSIPAISPNITNFQEILEQNMPDFPEIKEQFFNLRQSSWFSILKIYIASLLSIHFLCFLFTVLRNILGLRWRWPKEPLAPVRKTTKEEALTYDTPLSGFYEIAKTVFFTVSGLALLRAFLAVSCFVLGVMAINISTIVPHPAWYFVWCRVTRFFIYMVMFWLTYYWIHIDGRPATRSEVKLLLANHTGMLEVMVLYGAALQPSFVSRLDNLSIPLFTGIVRASDAILVDRSDKDSKHKTMLEIISRAKDPNAPQLMVFPEGTLNNQRALFRFNRGAFEAGEPVQIVLFKFVYKHFNPCWTGQAVGGNEIGDLLWRTCCQFTSELHVKFLPVYHPDSEEKSNPTLYTNHMQDLTAQHLDIPTSDATYQDYVVAREAFAKLQQDAQAEQATGWSSKRVKSGNKKHKAGGWWWPFASYGWMLGGKKSALSYKNSTSPRERKKSQ